MQTEFVPMKSVEMDRLHLNKIEENFKFLPRQVYIVNINKLRKTKWGKEQSIGISSRLTNHPITLDNKKYINVLLINSILGLSISMPDGSEVEGARVIETIAFTDKTYSTEEKLLFTIEDFEKMIGRKILRLVEDPKVYNKIFLRKH